MVIAEIFESIQGEGELTGMPSLFIRTSGCNLRCNWCDTDYASWHPEGKEMSVEEILKIVEGSSLRYVVITGGEPMIAPGMVQLANKIESSGKHITIETAGTVAPDGIACSLVSISPKLQNSMPDERLSENWRKRHDRERLNVPVLQSWIDTYAYQLKFVVQKSDDIDEILELLKVIDRKVDPGKVLLMPEGFSTEELKLKEKIVLELCQKYQFRYCNRLHIELFGNKKGT